MEHVPPHMNTEEKEAKCPTLHHMSYVLSVVLLGRETGLPHLLAPNLLTGGKGTDLVVTPRDPQTPQNATKLHI
jgi:hypothetical protein